MVYRNGELFLTIELINSCDNTNVITGKAPAIILSITISVNPFLSTFLIIVIVLGICFKALQTSLNPTFLLFMIFIPLHYVSLSIHYTFRKCH